MKIPPIFYVSDVVEEWSVAVDALGPDMLVRFKSCPPLSQMRMEDF